MTKISLILSQAESLAERIKAALAPGCERIEIVGSVLRRKAEVGDIELLAIPEMGWPTESGENLFGERIGEKASLLDGVIQQLLDDKHNFRRADKNGLRLKNFTVTVWIGLDEVHIPIELWLTTAPQWGIIHAIRTGPKDFSKHLVTQAHKYGPLPAGYIVSGGWLRYNGQPVDTPDEEMIFDLIGYEWRPPAERDGWREWGKLDKGEIHHGKR